MQTTTLVQRRNVLSISADAKTVKGEHQGYLTGILYMTPYTGANGENNMCAMAETAQCHIPCLYTAGRGTFDSVAEARKRKTLRFLDHATRNDFMLDIAFSIRFLVRKAYGHGLTPVVRLNGTTDMRWENISITEYDPATDTYVTYANIFVMFPDVQFYDYTKIPNRRVAGISNYDLTFSYSGVQAFQPYVAMAVRHGMRVAVVYRDRDAAETAMAAGYAGVPVLDGMPVVDGDESDLRFLDPQGCVTALYAKGRAKHDVSGFVVA